MNPYDPHNYDDYYADEYGGYGNSNDRRGGQRGGGRDRDGGRFGRGPRGPMGGMGGGGPRGGYGPPRGGMGGGYDRGNGWGGPMNGGGNMMNQPPPNMMGGGMGGPMSGGDMDGPSRKTTTQVTIPKDVSFFFISNIPLV